MPIIDKQAKDPLRHRRNAQRLGDGDVTNLVSVAGPLLNNGTTISLGFEAPLIIDGGTGDLTVSVGQGLQIAGGGNITVKLADTSLQTAAGGLSLHLAGTASGLQVTTGVSVKLTDTSLVLATTGLAVNRAASSGLAIVSGLKANPDGTTITINAGNQLATLPGAVFPVVATDPVSPTNGQAWYNSTSQFNKVQNPTGLLTVGGVLYSIPNSFNISGTTAGGALTSFGAGPTIPANTLVAGRVLRIQAHGTYTTGTNPTSVVLGVVLVNGATQVTLLATVLPAAGIPGGLANLPWYFDATMAIQTTGVGGTFNGLIPLFADVASVPNNTVGLGGGTGSIDTTKSWRVDCGVLFGTSQSTNAALLDTEFVYVLA